MRAYKPGAPLLLTIKERRFLYRCPDGTRVLSIGATCADPGAELVGEETETLTYRQRVDPAAMTLMREVVGRTLDGTLTAEDASDAGLRGYSLTLEEVAAHKATHA